MGHIIKMIHASANMMVSNATILEDYFTSVETQYFQYFQSLT